MMDGGKNEIASLSCLLKKGKCCVNSQCFAAMCCATQRDAFLQTKISIRIPEKTRTSVHCTQEIV